MPAHDWTRVSAGTFHDFHCCWIPEIRNRLNTGILPADYYAQVEQSLGEIGADILTLHTGPSAEPPDSGGTALAVTPPKVRFTASLEMDTYAAKARRVVIRHSSDDRIIALIEVVSPGNKAGRGPFRAFVEKSAAALSQGYHLLIVDLFFAPGPRDPEGIHGAIWAELGGEPFHAPKDKPLTQVAYSAGLTKTAYVEPFAVGDSLAKMALFLTSAFHVLVPLEETYEAAYRGVPWRWREVLEKPAG